MTALPSQGLSWFFTEQLTNYNCIAESRAGSQGQPYWKCSAEMEA